MSYSQIAEFYANRSVFITGGTGFLGKVLIEKLLRSCPQIKHIYLLIRSKKGQSVETRIKGVIDAKIFDNFNEWKPNPINKIIVIEGDITLPGLGISENDLATLIGEVSVVFHSAATVKFEEPLRFAVNCNVLGTQRVIQLCKQLNKLSALIYVSTAYSNCNRFEINETVYPSPVSPQKIIDLCEWMSDEMLAEITPQLIEGFPNTYTFTKNLAESLIQEECDGIPVAIVRPSIVCSSWKEPVKGWVDSIVGVTGFQVASGMGLLRHLYGQRNKHADPIPVDTVINLMIALVWFTSTKKSSLEVYNCTSGSMIPITWEEVLEFMASNAIKYPYSKIYRYPNVSGTYFKLKYKISIFFDHSIPAHFVDGLMYLIGRKRFIVKTYDKMHKAFETMNFFINNEFNFSNKKSMALNQLLNESDKTIFNFDIESLDWTEYFSDYWLGVRQYILKESNETLPNARQNLRKVYFRDMCSFLAITFFTFRIIYKRIPQKVSPKCF